jgi:hypothetical protein
LLLVLIAGLSCGTEISFLFFFPAAFPLAFFSLGLEVAGGGVVSRAGSSSSWFEPLLDLHMSYVRMKNLPSMIICVSSEYDIYLREFLDPKLTEVVWL